MDNDKIIERTKPSLNFIEQVQDQIQLCRGAISDLEIPLIPKVEALESLLWAKLKDDDDYKKTKKEINSYFYEKTKDLEEDDWKQNQKIISYQRNRARKKFHAIIVFIDTKKLIPMGDEDE